MPFKLPGNRLFDDPATRARFLEHVQLTGYDALAAQYADVSLMTVTRWAKEEGKDQKEFNELWALAKLLHSQEIANKLQQEALNGHEEPIYNKDGVKVGIKKKYETPLRAMMLKRHDEAFRDKIDVNHGAQTGVMVMPQPVESVGAWAALVSKAKEEATQRALEEKGKEP
jgi:hypothetical protein